MNGQSRARLRMAGRLAAEEYSSIRGGGERHEGYGSRGVGARGVDDGDVESRRARRHPLETHFERKVHDTGSLMVPSKRAASPEGKNAIHVVNAKSAAASHDTRSPARLEALRALRMAPRGSSGAFAIPRSSLCSRAPESADSPAPPTHGTAKGPTAMTPHRSRTREKSRRVDVYESRPNLNGTATRRRS